MCPVCGTPLALAEEAPQAKRERAFIQRQIDRVQVEGRRSSARWSPSSATGVLALPGDEGSTASATARLHRPRRRRVLLAAAIVRRRRALAPPRRARPRRGRANRAATPRALDADMERYDL